MRAVAVTVDMRRCPGGNGVKLAASRDTLKPTGTITTLEFAGTAPTSAIEPDTATVDEADTGVAVKPDNLPALIELLQQAQVKAKAARWRSNG
jgi:hypothetical protein